MTDCTVTGNSGTDGGGVANYGTLTMIGSTVSHNSTELNSVGGGLFNQGTMTLINSTVANNFGALWRRRPLQLRFRHAHARRLHDRRQHGRSRAGGRHRQ